MGHHHIKNSFKKTKNSFKRLSNSIENVILNLCLGKPVSSISYSQKPSTEGQTTKISASPLDVQIKIWIAVVH